MAYALKEVTAWRRAALDQGRDAYGVYLSRAVCGCGKKARNQQFSCLRLWNPHYIPKHIFGTARAGSADPHAAGRISGRSRGDTSAGPSTVPARLSCQRRSPAGAVGGRAGRGGGGGVEMSRYGPHRANVGGGGGPQWSLPAMTHPASSPPGNGKPHPCLPSRRGAPVVAVTKTTPLRSGAPLAAAGPTSAPSPPPPFLLL